MKVPAFSEDRDQVASGLKKSLEVGILRRRAVGPACGSEGHDLGGLQGKTSGFSEKFDVFGIGPRPSALDVMDPQLI